MNTATRNAIKALRAAELARSGVTAAEWEERAQFRLSLAECSHGLPAGRDTSGKARLPGENCTACKGQMKDYARRDRSRDMTEDCYS